MAFRSDGATLWRNPLQQWNPLRYRLGRVRCTREFVNQGGGEAHADLRRDPHRAVGVHHEVFVITGRAGLDPSARSARLTFLARSRAARGITPLRETIHA